MRHRTLIASFTLALGLAITPPASAQQASAAERTAQLKATMQANKAVLKHYEWVETTGIGSTWIRGADRTLTTIPNAALSKISVINFGRCDEILPKSITGVRYETSPEQLRCLLAKIREILLGHASIRPDSVRARFTGFGASSLDIEVFAYVKTTDRAEFLGIQEDVLLRVMDLVAQSGTGFAFPSQTLYFGRDDGLDAKRTEAAEAQVRQWRDEGRLPFPDFSPEEEQKLRVAVSDPPPGSSARP